jgi:probable rRNA maturation factor
MLSELGLTGVELSVMLADDATLRELNRDYRQIDRPTDVLSFQQGDLDLRRGPPKGPVGLLGDVVISVPTALRQAKRRRRPLLDEITMLLAHGILHLCGYDHETDAQEQEMNARARILEEAARSRGPTAARKKMRRPRST